MQLDKILDGVTAHTRWCLFEFNSEEDLVLMTSEGRLFILDIVLGVLKEKIDYEDFTQSANDLSIIEAAKFDQINNTVVFKTKGNRFYYVNQVTSEGLKNN